MGIAGELAAMKIRFNSLEKEYSQAVRDLENYRSVEKHKAKIEELECAVGELISARDKLTADLRAARRDSKGHEDRANSLARRLAAKVRALGSRSMSSCATCSVALNDEAIVNELEECEQCRAKHNDDGDYED